MNEPPLSLPLFPGGDARTRLPERSESLFAHVVENKSLKERFADPGLGRSAGLNRGTTTVSAGKSASAPPQRKWRTEAGS
ncbi:enterochelin esterase-like enzyme [Arthrobacter sp. UYCo732]